jgi:hypothetical protein
VHGRPHLRDQALQPCAAKIGWVNRLGRVAQHRFAALDDREQLRIYLLAHEHQDSRPGRPVAADQVIKIVTWLETWPVALVTWPVAVVPGTTEWLSLGSGSVNAIKAPEPVPATLGTAFQSGRNYGLAYLGA